jgi:hypothetical protein
VCIPNQFFPLLGKCDVAGRSQEQLGSEILLEQPNVAAEGRRKNLEFLRCPTEVQFFSGGNEASQMI